MLTNIGEFLFVCKPSETTELSRHLHSDAAQLGCREGVKAMFQNNSASKWTIGIYSYVRRMVEGFLQVRTLGPHVGRAVAAQAGFCGDTVLCACAVALRDTPYRLLQVRRLTMCME